MGCRLGCCQGFVNTRESRMSSRHLRVLVRICCHRVLRGMEIICVWRPIPIYPVTSFQNPVMAPHPIYLVISPLISPERALPHDPQHMVDFFPPIVDSCHGAQSCHITPRILSYPAPVYPVISPERALPHDPQHMVDFFPPLSTFLS